MNKTSEIWGGGLCNKSFKENREMGGGHSLWVVRRPMQAGNIEPRFK